MVETEVGGGRWGYSAYAPAYSGPAVPAATAKRWLTQAGTRLIAVRAAIASTLSQIVDTLIFITVAFYGVRPIAELIVGQAIAKVILSIIMVPFLIMLLVSIGRRLDRSGARDSA